MESYAGELSTTNFASRIFYIVIVLKYPVYMKTNRSGLVSFLCLLKTYRFFIFALIQKIYEIIFLMPYVKKYVLLLMWSKLAEFPKSGQRFR